MVKSLETPDSKIKEFNAKLISFFLFQYSMLIPLAIFFNVTILVGISSSIILLIALIGNRRVKINSKVLFLAIIIFILILIKTILYQDGGYSVLISYFTIVCPALYIISLPFNREKFMEFSYKLAMISFFLIFWIPFFKLGINYMRFGYGMAPTAVFLYCQLTHQKAILGRKKKVIIAMIFISSLIEIAIFGARGSIIPVILIILLNMFVINRISYKVIVPVGLSVVAYFNLGKIVDFVFSILEKANIHSYSLIKIRMQMTKGAAAASSGRDTIYENTILRIKQSPFFGNDLTGGLGDTYTHNIFLQITEEFGVFVLIIFLIFLLACLGKMFNKKIQESDRLIFAILFSLSMGRLLFSSSYWMRPEFWLFVGFGLLLSAKTLNSKEITQ